MAKVTIINEADAPAKASVSAPNENQEFARNLLDSMTVGKAAQVALDPTDNIRALKRAITTVANQRRTEVVQFLNEDKTVLTVRHKEVKGQAQA